MNTYVIDQDSSRSSFDNIESNSKNSDCKNTLELLTKYYNESKTSMDLMNKQKLIEQLEVTFFNFRDIKKNLKVYWIYLREKYSWRILCPRRQVIRNRLNLIV
jgi:hypothetical protein